MYNLNKIYRPITAHPFESNETYVEIEPCEALKPYICCFWGTSKPYSKVKSQSAEGGLVIPDTCMDIIFDIDHNSNKVQSVFCGINDTSFYAGGENTELTKSCFAIRFYFWAVSLFSHESMKSVLNAHTDVDSYFMNFKRELEDIIMRESSIEDRVAAAENYLLSRINIDKKNDNVMNSIYYLLKSKGAASISEMSDYTTVSQRQLERLFTEYVGVTPKKLSSLIRYQYLWQDIIYNPSYNIQDLVFKYSYTDQSHLIKHFKKYHKTSPKEAKALALKEK